MNKSLKGLLIALTVFSTASASTSNNKTSLNTRICRDTVPAYTTFHEMISDKNDDRLDGNVEVTGFYGRSVNGSHLAKNFGADGTGSIDVVASTDTYPALTTLRPQVLNNLLLHNQAHSTNTLLGKVNFDPQQTAYGLRLDYFQRFDKWVDGLFLHVILPVVHVTNDINMTVANSAKGFNVAEGTSIEDLLTGKKRTPASTVNAQDALCYAKMCGNSNTGLGDIEARIGWRFLEGNKYHAAINAGVIFPTADEPDAKYLWGARTGDSKWGVGAGFDGSALLWEKDDQNLKFLGTLQYKYLFEDTEKRALGLKELRYKTTTAYDTLHNPILSQYYLVGEVGKAGLKPLANVSTLDVDVQHGSQLDGILAFAYNNGGFTLDFGYNMFWKEAEGVNLKSGCNTSCGTNSSSWTENKYGVANYTYNSTAVFNTNGIDTLYATADTTAGFIKASDLNTQGDDAIIKHKVFLGTGYIAKSWDYPVMVGAGVSYEIPSSNKDAAEGYSLWTKVGVAF